MNTSYKIVLLAAFVVFTAVIGYVVFFSGTPDPEPVAQGPGDDAAQPDDENPEAGSPPPTRTGLDTAGPPEPERQVTIGGPTFDDPLADPLNDPIDDGGSNTTPGTRDRFADRTTGLSEPSPGERLGPSIDDIPEDDERTGSRESGRIGPGVETGTGDTDTTDEPDTTGGSDPIADEPTPPAPRETETETEPAEPERTTPRSTPRTYTVKAGDLLSTIAVEVYGDQSKWFDIAQANPTIDPKRLQVGQVIALPALDGNGGGGDEARPPAPGRDQTYTVRPGDNLSRIASKFYGDSEKWDLIYARNRNAIGPRPDNLQVGMKLTIPQAIDGAE